MTLPVSNFITNVTSGYVPLTVQFTDQSTDATEWNWDFGDGSDSTEQNPMHTYYTEGEYTIKLTASNAYGSDTFNQTLIVNDITFMPIPKGYSFENFDGPEHTISDFHNTYGLSVNLNNTNSKVTVFYLTDFRNLSASGDCFGMATTSMLLYSHGVNNTYSYNFTDEIPIDWYRYEPPTYDFHPRNLDSWIMSYQTLQLDKACMEDKGKYKAYYSRNDYHFIGLQGVYDELKRRLASNDPVALGIYGYIVDSTTGESDQYGGHAVVPYKIIENQEEQSARIYVYDCDHPGDFNRYIEVNLANGTEYVYDYEVFEGVQLSIYGIDLCSLEAIKEPPQMPEWATIVDFNNANMLYTDNLGRKLGYDHGLFKDEIPGSCSMIPYGEETNSDSTESYYVPDTSIKTELFGVDEGWSKVSMITLTGLIIADVSVSPTSVDEFKILNNGKGIYFNSENGTTSSLSLMVDVETPDVAQIVRINVSEIETNGAIDLSNNNGIISIQNYGQPRTCSLHLEQTGISPNSDDRIKNIAIDGNSIVNVKPSSWDNIAGSDITIEHDVGGDGTIDYIEVIKPENTMTIPVANFTNNVTIGYIPLTVQFTDISTNATSWSWDFGDGATSTEQNPTHIYPEAGTYNINLTAINSNGTDSKTATINVLVPPPTINSITVPLDPVSVDTSITTSADITYLGGLNDLTAEWNWADGSTSEPQVSSNFAASHVYNSPGIYTVTFTIKDINGGIYTHPSPNYVVVYNPTGGFVTGGGWINSPAGAYVLDST